MDNIEKYILEHRTDFDTEIPSLKLWASIEKRLDTEGVFEQQIEQFIGDNRSRFDTEIPNLKIWAAIDKQVNQSAERRLIAFRWLRYAAAAAVLLAVGAMGGIFFNEKREAVVVEKQVEEVSPNFKETEKFYNEKVKAQLTKLAKYQNQDPSVISDLEQIDEVQQELKQELEGAPTSAREEIVKRMMDNYQIKLDILERVLKHLEQEKLEKENSIQHESI